MPPLLIADAISKTYGQLKAVEALSLEIPAGETFGLLGPNGAGKSTTIAMLMGLLRPDQGKVTIAGRSTQDPTTRQMIGLAPQDLSLYMELTAEENLKFFGRLYRLAGNELRQRVDQMLELAQLQDRRSDRVSSFSGGMKRRLNIAVALLHQPQILLLDEPTVGVDPQSRNHILEWIQQLAKAGLTVLYTTHYMEEAERLCDRIGILDHGKLLAIGDRESLCQQYTPGSLVRFHSDTDLPWEDLMTDLPRWEKTEQGISFYSRDPLRDLAVLGRKGVDVKHLEVTQPALETVFLTLTGRSLRD